MQIEFWGKIIGVKLFIVQFYDIRHNSQSDCWIEIKLYEETPDILFYLGLKLQVNDSSRRPCKSDDSQI
jgi:hypothetical protein